MKEEIEKILLADEAARKRLESAHAEAQDLRDKARRKAEEISLRSEKELDLAAKEGLERLVDEALRKARRIGEETESYAARIERKKRESMDELIEGFIEKVLAV